MTERKAIMRSTTTIPISALLCIALTSCGESPSGSAEDTAVIAAEETDGAENQNPDLGLLETATNAGESAKQVAETNGLAGAMTATIEGEERIFFIAGDDNNLIEWNEAEDGSTHVEIIGSPVADDWQWKDSMELTFNVIGTSVSEPQLIFRSMGSTDFHRTTGGQIVVSELAIDGSKLTVAGSFSGRLSY
ncbi:hypothetical protein [Aurantiacibacter gilvus]|uniref:Lipoprotein n=1 Tax=Aurantiacibacter gilvus TaxID=3139141 RepID=A0ABU9IFW9_9SPHN